MVKDAENLTEDEKARTLYVRLPKTIKDDKEVHSLFQQDVKVKLPRQSSKCCHVIFPTVAERTKCLKTMKKKLVNGKRIILMPLSEKSLDKRSKKFEKKKETQKKVSIPIPVSKVEETLIQTLHVSNIPKGIPISQVKQAFPGCSTIAFLKGIPGKKRSAVVKMEKVELATAYLKKEIPAPKIKENVLKICQYNKQSKSRREKKKLLKLKQESSKSDSEAEEEEEEED